MAQNRERVLQRWNSHRVATEGDLNDDRDTQEQASQIQKVNARLELPRVPKHYLASIPGRIPSPSVNMEPTLPTTADLRVSPARSRRW